MDGMRYDKEGNKICQACGHYWESHTIGGNCLHSTLTPENYIEFCRRYSEQPKKKKGESFASTV